MLAAVLPLLACRAGERGGSSRWQTVIDTVGDTVVARTLGATDSAALLRLVPELRIGQLEGADAYQFADVEAVAPTPDGGAYVWDGTLLALRRYDSTGRFVRHIGGRGGGPGEFESSNGMAVLPDGRLLLWDQRQQRVNVYDSAGAPAASWRWSSRIGTSDGVLVDTAGAVYLQDLTEWEAPEEVKRRWPVRLVRFADVAGTVRDTLLPPPASASRPTLSATSASPGAPIRGATAWIPFTPTLTWAWSPHGFFVSSTGDRYAVVLHRPDRSPLRIERDVAPVTVPPEERRDYEEDLTAYMRDVHPAWRWTGPSIPGHKPFVLALLVGGDGRVWVQRSGRGERRPEGELPARRRGQLQLRWRELVAYDVFEPDGRYLGFLPVPHGTRLLHMRGDRVWGVVRDTLDVPYVTRFRLDPPLSTRAEAMRAR